MKIALVHDYLGEFGGAERVLLALSDIWPDAPIYTAFWRPGEAWERFKHRDIRVSWAHRIPLFSTKLHSPLRFLAPAIWNSFDFSEYDIVVGSSSWYVTKGFIKKGKAVEICYCHTPPRWLYGYPTSIEWQRHSIVRWYATIVGFFMRHYDWNASSRVDHFLANSQNTARRIQKFYRRDSTVIYPPVTIPSRTILKKENYYLVISRIVGGKGLELAVGAASKLGFRLKIAGAPAGYATELKKLLTTAGKTVDFLGYVSDETLARLYAGARGFLATSSDEDFGITPLEAMAAGTPVIAFRGGGYTESVIEGKTGVFFDEPTVDSLVTAICTFQKLRFSPEACRTQAELFSKKRFQKEIVEFVRTHGPGTPDAV
ncbi:MAG: glycosyltransferase [Patescibacteria group bacterium]